jgi:hypothetical protein
MLLNLFKGIFMQIDISNIPKEEILAALYNKANVQGRGYLQSKPGVMSLDEAKLLITGEKDPPDYNGLDRKFGRSKTYFDYLFG